MPFSCCSQTFDRESGPESHKAHSLYYTQTKYVAMCTIVTIACKPTTGRVVFKSLDIPMLIA